MTNGMVDNNQGNMLVITILPVHFGGGGSIHNIEVLKELNKRVEVEVVPSVTWNLVAAISNDNYKEKLLKVVDEHGLRLAEPVLTLFSQKYKTKYKRLDKSLYGSLLVRELAKLFQGKMYKVVYSQSEFIIDLYLAARIGGLNRGFLTQGLWFTKDFITDMKLELATDYYKPWSFEFWKRMIYRSIFRNSVYHMIKRHKFNFILTVNPKLVEWNGLSRFNDVEIEVVNPGNAYPAHILNRPEERKEQYFVYYGRLVPTKGLFIIPRIVKDVVKEHDDFKLFIFGSFPDETLRRKFFEKIYKLKIEDNIKYLGFLSDEEKFKIIAKAKGFLFPSLVDVHPLSILESLALKTSVITTRLPTLEWLYHGLPAVKLCDNLRCFVQNVKDIWRMEESEYYAMFNDKQKMFLALHSDWKKVAEAETNLLLKFISYRK